METVRPSIEIVSAFRRAPVEGNRGECHPLATKRMAQ
jgi:hypothetical protein